MPVMPSPARKQKIVRVFFQKRAIELQTAVLVTATKQMTSISETILIVPSHAKCLPLLRNQNFEQKHQFERSDLIYRVGSWNDVALGRRTIKK